jgi:pyruvate-formate lyase-activating enzyme
MRIDRDIRQDLGLVDLKTVRREARAILRKYPANRLVRHLVENCVFRYGCPAARNFSLGRFECPLPVSRACNSGCLGCISRQPKSAGFPASHDRICFRPSPEEVAEVAVQHLERAEHPVVSFGQGCEGEPLTEGKLLEESIRLIRKKTRKGIINLNTNASMPDVMERLCRAGLDSVRVSLSSAKKKYYDLYYKPRNYSFEDVVKSLKIASRHGCWTSVNYLMFPGFTDDPDEMKALDKLLAKVDLDMIQTRNLNIDPEWYAAKMGLKGGDGRPIGMRKWIRFMRKKHPTLKLGYFNPSQKTMRPWGKGHS